jgi:hypothetical protein
MSVLTVPACQPQEKRSSILSRILLACTSQTDTSVLRVDPRLTDKLSLSLWHLSGCPSMTKADKRRISWITSVVYLDTRMRRGDAGRDISRYHRDIFLDACTHNPRRSPAQACLGVLRLDDCFNWTSGKILLVEHAAQYLFDHARFEDVLYCQHTRRDEAFCLMLTSHVGQLGVGCKRYSR